MPRRAHRLDANQDVIVNALCAVPDVSVCSLAGVAAGCPDLLVGIRGVTHLVEVKDGAGLGAGATQRTGETHESHWDNTSLIRSRGLPASSYAAPSTSTDASGCACSPARSTTEKWSTESGLTKRDSKTRASPPRRRPPVAVLHGLLIRRDD